MLKKLSKVALTAAVLVSLTTSVLAKAPTTKKEKEAYALGIVLSQQIVNTYAPIGKFTAVQKTYLIQALTEVLNNKALQINQDEFNSIIAGIEKNLNDIHNKAQIAEQKKVQAVKNEALEKELAENLVNSTRYLREFEQKEGVHSTQVGYFYRVDNYGKGRLITLDDDIYITYTAKLANGEVFDKSEEIVKVKVSDLLPSIADLLRVFRSGASLEVALAPNLAFGRNGNASVKVPGNSAVVYNINVIAIEAEEKAKQEQGLPNFFNKDLKVTENDKKDAVIKNDKVFIPGDIFKIK